MGRAPERAILHVDMDAFFASVEQLDDPALRGKPVLVGGASRRGVVAAASYEARPFGVGSAMPMAQALERCPNAVVVPPRMARYVAVSASVFEIFRRYTPLVEGLSLDEAFLDVTASQSLFGEGPAIAARVRAEISAELSLTASAGVATSKFVAKIASDLNKPDGLAVVPPGEERAFLAPLPITRMWGVGAKAAAKLRGLGYRTLGDLAGADPRRLEEILGSFGPSARQLARGEDSREVTPEREAKSIGAEETYERDLTSREAIERSLLAHASRVAGRLHRAGCSARVVVVKLKYADFTLRTRQARLAEPVDDAGSIYEAAKSLLDRFPIEGRRVRLTGISAAELIEGPPPPTLLPDPRRDKRRAVQALVTELEDRFGGAGAKRAALLDRPPRR